MSRRHVATAILFSALSAVGHWLDVLPRLELAVLAGAFVLGRLVGGSAALAGFITLAVRHDLGWVDTAHFFIGLAAAVGAALLLRRTAHGRSDASSAIARTATLLGVALLGGFLERCAIEGSLLPDHGDVAFATLRVLTGVLITAGAVWRPRSERSTATLFAAMVCVFATAGTALFTVEFWQRQDDALLSDIAGATVAGFGATVSDNLNTLSVKASTSATDPFTADRFPSLMQTTVFSRTTVTGVALVDLGGAGTTVLSNLSQSGPQFDLALNVAARNHREIIAKTVLEGIQSYLGVADLPTATGGVQPCFLYSFPIAPVAPATVPTTALVAALSIPELLSIALVPTRAAAGEASVRIVDEAADGIGHILVWSTEGDWFPTDEDSSVPPTADPAEQIGRVAVDELFIGDASFDIVVERQVGLGSPILFRRLVLLLETLSGLLLLGVVIANSSAVARRERDRERREALLGAALEGAAGWTAIVDHTDRVVMANRGPHGTAAGTSVFDAPLWREDDGRTLLASVLTDARDGRQGIVQQVWADPDDDSHAMRIFDIEARPLPDPDLVYVQCVDVTENRNRAMRTAQSERMEAIGVLAGGLAHDFNNLLFITLGYLQMLERQPLVANDPQANTYVRRAVEAVERGAVVAKSLLSFARSQPLAATQLSMHEFVSNLTPLVEQAIGATHKLNITIHDDGDHDDDLNVLVDPGRLSSSVLNIVFNARDAMEGPGSLNIDISRAIAAPPDGELQDVVSIAVTDTGKGLSPEVLARAFDPFFTTKNIGSGTGLGLSTVYSFAQQSGGWATIESAEGKGATITIYLPAVHGTSTAPTGDTQLQTAATRALVVDDEPALADLVAGWLEQFGMQTMVANTPQTAIRLAREFQPHLLVSDANLGDVIDGLELARLLVEQDPALMVVFMTGFSDRIKALQRAGVATLAKPFSADDLYRTLSTHLGERFAENARREGTL